MLILNTRGDKKMLQPGYRFNRFMSKKMYNWNTKLNLVWIPIDNSVNNDLDGVQVRQQVDNFHSMLNNANCHQLLSIVASVHHKRVGQPLHNWGLGLPKPLCLVSSSSVRHVGWVLSSSCSYVILNREIRNLYKTIIINILKYNIITSKYCTS